MRWTKTWDERKRKVEESEDAITRGQARRTACGRRKRRSRRGTLLPFRPTILIFSRVFLDSSHAKDLSMPNIETKSPKKWVGNEGRPSALPSLLPMFTDFLPIGEYFNAFGGLSFNPRNSLVEGITLPKDSPTHRR